MKERHHPYVCVASFLVSVLHMMSVPLSPIEKGDCVCLVSSYVECSPFSDWEKGLLITVVYCITSLISTEFKCIVYFYLISRLALLDFLAREKIGIE